MLPENTQLMALIEQGLTVEEIADSLDQDVDAVRLALESIKKNRNKTMEELVQEFRPEAVKILMDVARYGENESARVAAAKIIVAGEGMLPELSSSKLTDQFRRMRAIVEKNRPANVVPLDKAVNA